MAAVTETAEIPREALNMPSRLPKRRVVLAWDMHYSCNYRCPYCFYTEAGWTELAKKSTYKTAEEWVEVWTRMHEKYGRCQLRITAGEPFTYPRFVDVIEAVSKLHDIQITSNCSQSDAMRDFVERVSPEQVELDCTYHPLQGEFEPFVDNVKRLRGHGFTANVCFLAYPPQMKGMAELKERFKDSGVYMNMAIFWGRHKDAQYPQAYTADERAGIKAVIGSDISAETVGLDPIPINGKICGAGQRYAVVQADGRVYRCGQLGYEGMSIGSIFDPGFELHRAAKPCSVDFCRCKEFQSAWEDTDIKLLNEKGKVRA
ncbi:MAG: radical SAM protein [Elusimicrobia bacterium]|nr:radical SAM protein [Elusimicrobiota bacterium]